jgi:hypothetical protein
VAVAIGLTGILLTGISVRHVELVSGQYLSTGVPPLPAFAILLLLSLLRPLLLRFAPRFAPTRPQILLSYIVMAVGVVLCGLYHVRALLPELVALQFWSRDGGPLAPLVQYLPAGLVPAEAEAVRHYYVGSPGGGVPWSVWLGPLLGWSAFLLLLFLGLVSAAALVQRQWIHHEKLQFPLKNLPLALTADDWSAYGSEQSRRFLFGLGFGLAFLFNALNILHSLFPAFPAPGFSQPLLSGPVDRPWTALRPVRFYFEIETIGIGYFVPLDVTFSIWFFYLLNRISAVWGISAGLEMPGFPFTQEQCAGGYVAMGLLLIWGLRRSLSGSFRRLLRRGLAPGEDAPERWAWVGLAVSAAGVLGFCQLAGFSWKLAALYFGILGLFVLTYMRIRGETGVPFQYTFPYGQAKESMLSLLGFHRAVEWGGARSLVLLSMFSWLSRFHHAQEVAAYQLDSIKLADEARLPRRTIFWASLIAFAFGLAVAYWAHLGAYYAQGSNLIASAGGFGEYRERVARQDYQQMATRLTHPPFPDEGRLYAMLGGFAFTSLLVWLRHLWVGCPFHPLGFLIATSTGDLSTASFPMFVAWLSKFMILRVGGLPLYRRFMPMFLGLTVGHLLVGGILWPFFALLLSKEAANAYHLLFGE